MQLAELVQIIEKALPGAQVLARDLTGGGDHYEAVVVCSAFEGLSTLKRHRAVLDALAEVLKGPLHAFTFKTYTPQEWDLLGSNP